MNNKDPMVTILVSALERIAKHVCTDVCDEIAPNHFHTDEESIASAALMKFKSIKRATYLELSVERDELARKLNVARETLEDAKHSLQHLDEPEWAQGSIKLIDECLEGLK